MAGAEAEKVAEFVVGPAEPGGRSGTFEAPHGPIAAFDAAVVLLQPVIQVGAGPVPHSLAQLGPDCPRVAVVAVRCDPALVRNSGGGRRAVVGRAFRRCAATPASRAGSSGSAPSSRPGLRSSGPAEPGRAGRDR